MIFDKTIEFAVVGKIIDYDYFMVAGKRTEALEAIFETSPGTIIDNDYGYFPLGGTHDSGLGIF